LVQDKVFSDQQAPIEKQGECQQKLSSSQDKNKLPATLFSQTPPGLA